MANNCIFIQLQDAHSMENNFLTRITEIIEENLSNEKFGVSELAAETGMSRSNLLRKVNKLARLSVSQFIRQVRLKNAMDMLRQNSFTVSEVTYRVGFSSTSYFIKCFREYYGYPPGEVGKRDLIENESVEVGPSNKKRRIVILGAIISIVVFAIVLFVVTKPFSSKKIDLEKSIAVLPFNNDSNDSTNIYIINGLMESILDNLQQIEDLRVISRTSVEKYRDNSRTIPEIARELNANYLVEGSGQKIGDQILLNIQLIEAPGDKRLWAEQYNRKTGDIFKLQMEVAKSIADEIEAIITPEEEERIDKPPTEDLVAYDYFLKGLNHFYKGTREGLLEAIPLFEKAIEHDPGFARAYADISIAYAFLDMYQYEKKYSVEIDNYADKALLYDPQLPQSLIAKAMFHITREEYEPALPYLEKALEYNPNSSLVINILSDFYTRFLPDTEKYLEYALMGIGLDIASHDSAEASFIYLHISNALMQSGFISDAEKYIDLSLEYDPDNLYSEILKAYILFARDRDLQQTKELLIEALRRDTSRYDIIREIGLICYYMRDYECAYTYYKELTEIMVAQNLDLYRSEYAKIGVVWSEVGLTEESENYFSDYLEYAESDNSIYKHLSLAVYYSYEGNTQKAVEQMELFAQEENYPYWYILFLEIDPLFDHVKDLPEFNRILSRMKIEFWENHKQIKASLDEKGLL